MLSPFFIGKGGTTLTCAPVSTRKRVAVYFSDMENRRHNFWSNLFVYRTKWSVSLADELAGEGGGMYMILITL